MPVSPAGTRFAAALIPCFYAYGGYQISEIGPDGGSTSLTSGFQSIGMVTEFIRGALWATHWANQREAARVAKEN